MTESAYWRRIAAVAVLASALPALHAADTNGRIRGTVTDPTGAVIPNVTVTATNQATGVKFTTTSNASGLYLFAQLPIGAYTISASPAGFKSFSATNIVLNIDQEYVEPIQVSAGSTSENVSVEADAVQVNTTDMQFDNVVTSAQMVELPLIGRNFTALEQIEPGIQASSDRFGGYSANGAQTQQSSFLINGADVNDIAINTVGLQPNLDTIDQFNLVTGPLNAEYDRNSGGIVSATIKQGSNHIHGDAFEFYRDTFLNTGNYFSYVPAQPATSTSPAKAAYKNVTAYHQNIFGGTIGAPVLKDKLFLFGGYQGTHQRVPNSNGSNTTTVFSAAQLGGDFSADINGSALGLKFSQSPIPGTIKIPGCLPVTVGGVSTPQTWAQCAATNGGKFPTSVFNPIALALVKQYVPAANQGTNSYVFNNISSETINQYIGRIDFDPSPKDQFDFVGIYQKTAETSVTPFTGASLPGFAELDGGVTQVYTGEYVHQFGPTLVNSFAVHYIRFNDAIVDNANTVQPSSLGFSINPQTPAFADVPKIGVNNYFTLGFSNNGPQPRIDQTYQLDDNMTKTFGHHNLKFGYDGRRFQVSNPFSANESGTYSFSSGTTFGSGDPGLDFLLGNPASYAQGTGATIQAYAFLNYLFAQDTWKATDTLTINYGLGYQIDSPLHNIQYGGEAIACFLPGQQSKIFPTAPAGVDYPGDPGCTNSAQAYTRYTDFGPRIGFAYAPDLGFLSDGNSKKLSIRGGFGIYYNRSEEETSLNNLETPPYGISSQGAVDYGAQAPAFANPYQDIDTGATYKNKFPYTFPTKGQAIDYSIFEPLGLNTYDKGFRSPYAENFQLSIERELPSKIIARVSYVGSLGRHNQITYEGNPITAAGHAACLADTKFCGNPTNEGYRDLQDYYFPTHTQYGIIDPNTGIPAFPTVGVVTTEGTSNYNSFQASAEKALSHGLLFQASYTLSHSLDDSSNYENAGYGGTTRGYNQFNKALNYGNSQFDARHRFVFAPVYTIPSIKSQSAFSPVNLLLTGWQVSGISTFATGFPFDISYGGGSSNSLYCSSGFTFYACADEPNQSGPLVRANPRTFIPGLNRTQWFVASQSGLSQAPLGSFGNISRDKFYGPGINNTNLLIAKNFNLRADGSVRMQIRMESDNVFNHTQFNNPSSTVSSGDATQTASGLIPATLSYGSTGQITGAANARLTQLSGKVYF
jgi:hypothetical protein